MVGRDNPKLWVVKSIKIEWRDLLVCFIVFSLAIIIILAATVSGPGVGPDSVTYLTMGANIYQGRGFVSDLAGPFDPEPYSPVTLWPPGYSLLIAALMGFGLTAIEAARLVSAISFGLLAGGVYWLGYTLAGRSVAILSCLATLTLMPIVRTASFALSDTSFMMYSVFAIIGMIQYVKTTSWQKLGWLIFSGICTALAILTRYTGVVWIFVGVLVIIFDVKFDWKRGIIHSIGYVLISVLPVLPWFARNWFLSGYVSGVGRTAGSDSTLAENMILISGTLARDLIPSIHLGIREILDNVPIYIWFLLVVVAIIMGLVGWIRWGKKLRTYFLQKFTQNNIIWKSVCLWLIIFAYIGAYILFHFLLGNVTLLPDYVWTRYLTPAYPLVLVLWTAIWVGLVKSLTNLWSGWARGIAIVLPALLWILPYSIQTAGFVEVAAQGQDYTAPEWRKKQFIDYLLEMTSKEDVIYSDSPYGISFLLERPVRFLPHSDEIEQFTTWLDTRMKPSSVNEYIIVFKVDDSGPQLRPRLSAAELAELAVKRSDIHLIANFEDVTIYKLLNQPPAMNPTSRVDE